MLTLDISEFMIQLKNGTINNVGGPTKTGTVKLFDVTTVEAHAFGDRRLKVHFADEEGNTVEVALAPEDVSTLETDLEEVRSAGDVADFGVEEP